MLSKPKIVLNIGILVVMENGYGPNSKLSEHQSMSMVIVCEYIYIYIHMHKIHVMVTLQYRHTIPLAKRDVCWFCAPLCSWR